MSDMESLRRRDFDRYDEVPLDRGARPKGPRPFPEYSDPRYRPQRFHVPRRDFGRGIPRFPLGPRVPSPLRFIPALDRALRLLDLLGEPNGLHPIRRDLKLKGMERCDGPYYNPGPEYIGWLNIDVLAHDCPDGQLGGQGLGSWWVGEEPGYGTCAGCGIQPLPQPGTVIPYPGGGSTPANAITYYVYCRSSLNDCWAHVGREQSSWTRVTVDAPWSVEVQAPALPDTYPWNIPPNVQRWMPPTPQPLELGVGTTVQEQAQELAEEWDKLTQAEQLMRSPAPAKWGVGFNFPFPGTAPGSGTRGSTGSFARPGTGTAPGTKPRPEEYIPPRLPAPPRENEKEQKARTRVAQLGRFLYNALDAASENAEVVDALFKALPCSVQKRWSKGRKDRRGVDSFGQYGAAGADWKLQALWHNWHKLDAAEAWQNIAWNLLQDQFYGLIHRRVPVQAGGPGMREQWLAFNDLLKEMPLHQPKECS